MSGHSIISVTGDEGFSDQWWTETSKMVKRGWLLFCKKRNMDPSQVVHIDVRRRRGRPKKGQNQPSQDEIDEIYENQES